MASPQSEQSHLPVVTGETSTCWCKELAGSEEGRRVWKAWAGCTRCERASASASASLQPVKRDVKSERVKQRTQPEATSAIFVQEAVSGQRCHLMSPSLPFQHFADPPWRVAREYVLNASFLGSFLSFPKEANVRASLEGPFLQVLPGACVATLTWRLRRAASRAFEMASLTRPVVSGRMALFSVLFLDSLTAHL